MKEIRPCDKRSKRLHTGPYIYLFHIMLTNLLCQGKMLYVCCVSTGEISTTLIQRQTKHIQKVIFLLQSVIRVIHTPNAKLPFMFRCYVWYFCYGLILTIYHESIWSQILFYENRDYQRQTYHSGLRVHVSSPILIAKVIYHCQCSSRVVA